MLRVIPTATHTVNTARPYLAAETPARTARGAVGQREAERFPSRGAFRGALVLGYQHC